MFIMALFVVAKKCKKSKCPLSYKWINKMWYIHAMECYLAIKRIKYWYVLQCGWTLETC